MKIVRAPLRVSLFGGGTDLEPYVSEHGSTIISFAIDRYMYLTWNPRPTGGCRLSYSEVEELLSLKDAQHTLVREAAQRYGIEEPCTLTIVSDVPKGTGLGSSSALAVCLTQMAYPEMWGSVVVKRASELEQAISSAGYQDYLPAAHGCIHVYHIALEEAQMPMWNYTTVSSIDGLNIGITDLSDGVADLINRYGMLFYTGNSRPADSVLPSWQKSEAQLHDIKALVDETAKYINTLSPDAIGAALNETWEMKRSIPGVTSPTLNTQYAVAIANGALGGKLCGAGSGGCWFFLVPPNSVTRAKVRNALGLTEIPFKIAEKGVETWEL